MSREVIIQRIEKSDLIDAKKELMIEIIQNKKEDDFDKKVDRLYRQFSKSSSFKKHAEKMVVRDDEKLKICNMMLVMSVTLTVFFFKAVLTQKFMVNFSIDAIIGCAAFVFAFMNVRTKYKTLKRQDLVRDFVYLDVLSLILCILFKMFFPVQVDFSLIILLVDYYLCKKRFREKAFQKLEGQACAGPFFNVEFKKRIFYFYFKYGIIVQQYVKGDVE